MYENDHWITTDYHWMITTGDIMASVYTFKMVFVSTVSWKPILLTSTKISYIL